MKSENSFHLPGLAALMAWILIGTCSGAPLDPAQTNKKPVEAKVPAAPKGPPVNVNSAPAETLETLPGIGPALAQRIIDGRPYKNLDELARVKGLGKARADALKDSVTFGATAAPTKKAAGKEKPANSKPQAPPAGVGAAPKAGSQSSGSSSASADRASTNSAGQKININRATAEELESLPGIGPVKAQAILDYRQQNGNFKAIEDIQNVKGIKEGEFSKIRDLIKVAN